MTGVASQIKASGQPARAAGQLAQVGAEEAMAHWSNLIEFAELVADALMALCQLLESQGTNRDIVKKLHSYPAKGLAV